MCGNCADDDGDGLTDFEDPKCCGFVAPMNVRRSSIRNNGANTRFGLRSCLAVADQSKVNPLVQDLYVQIRDTRTGVVLCSFIGAEHFMRLHKHAIAFWDRSGKVASARGIEDASVTYTKSCLAFYAFGRKLQYAAVPGNRYKVVAAFQNPRDPSKNVCTATTNALVSGKPLHSAGAR